MKKLGGVLGFMVVLATVSTAHAQHAQYGMAGCGLGSVAFGTDNTKLMQILAVFLNFTGGQVFGITSGTSNCVEGGVVKAEREQAAFAEVNFRDLKRNMAMGGGEYLASFSTLLGCEDAAKPAFYKMTQTKYESILPSESTTPVGMLTSLKVQIKADPTLARACTDERAIARAQGAKPPQQARPPAPAATNVAMAK